MAAFCNFYSLVIHSPYIVKIHYLHQYLSGYPHMDQIHDRVTGCKQNYHQGNPVSLGLLGSVDQRYHPPS